MCLSVSSILALRVSFPGRVYLTLYPLGGGDGASRGGRVPLLYTLTNMKDTLTVSRVVGGGRAWSMGYIRALH